MSEEDPQDKFETIPKEFGNGAHIVVPKDWAGDIVQLKRVGPQMPETFQNIEVSNFVEAEFETGEETWISGPVTEVQLNISETEMKAYITLEEDHKDEDVHDLYRIEANRSAGDDGWVNDFKIFKHLTEVEIEDIDDEEKLVELGDGDGTAVQVGTLKELSVKTNV